ncbi:hypothetical protein IW146_002294 [Coemansia sp. RSA 922]|nr:hypothetical protein IW146_002294 [Coemansia sp. RSA 922]
MTRSKLSFLAAAWLLAAYQVEAGPIATAADNAATSSELASLGGLLQALGAGVIGNGALLYPTAASSHQRAEAEILASDTATRVFKKVKSILKEGGINDDEDGGEESAKSVTYLVKPALIFHKEELPPPNPLAGNVLPLPGGALLYTPTPTAGANGEPTSGPAASIKAAYGNLFAASPYTPSYTLNKPHAAVIVEEVTDMLSLKSMQQRLEEAGEDDEEEEDEEDEYGRKKKGKKNIKFVTLESVDSTSAFVNPFTRADFPFGLMTPPAVPTQSKKESEEPKTSTRKTIKKMLSAKPTSTSASVATTTVASTTSAQLNASLGKDGGITIVANNLAQVTSSTIAPGTTIIIPPASLASSASAASSASSSAAPASSSVSIHEDSSKNDDVKANEVARIAHTSSAMPDMGDGTSVKGNRRNAATCDSLASSGASSMSGIADLAQATNVREAVESPVGTVGSSTEWHAESSATQASASEVPKHRKMHVVRVFEVKKNKSVLISGSSSSASVQTSSSSGDHMQKRDIMPLYDAPESTSMLEANPMETPMLAENYSTELIAPNTEPPNTYAPNTYPEPARMAPTVSNWQRLAKESVNENDSESDSDDEQGSKKIDSDAEKVSSILSMSKDNVSPAAAATDASASSSSASVESTGTASADSSSASVESSSVSAESTGTASAESSSASVNSSSVSAESSSAYVESTGTASAESSSASANSSSVSGDIKVEAASASTSVSGDSASASSTKATAQSTSSASAQSSSSVSAQSTSSVSAKKSGTAKSSSTSHAANSSSRSLSIEDIGAQETSVEKGSASEEAESDKKFESDSDSESDGESGVEKHEADERDASEEGDSESSDNESEIAKNEDSDDEEASPRTKVGSRERLAIVPMGNEGDSLGAIQRIAALGLREAEKAVEEFDKHSDAPEIEALTTQDEKPAMTSSASEQAATQSIAAAEAVASRSVASALSVAMSSLGQHASESDSQSPVRAAANKDRDDDSDDDKDDNEDKDEKRSKKEDSDDDDSDSDNEKGKSANSDDDSDDDSDSGSDKKKSSRRKKSSDDKEARGEFDKEANAARKAVSVAAAESAQQVVKTTDLDAMATGSASADFDGDKAERKALSEAASESVQQAVKVTATELDDAAATDSAMTDGSAVGRDVASASEDEMEFETHSGVNSDGEEVKFVTQLVPDEKQDKAERAKANESPSIVVMASIEEDYEEDYYTKPQASGARRSAHVSDNASNAIVPSRVQRNAVNAMNDVDDVYDEGDKVVRGVEPTPDISIIKESQNRAINIGLGNLRRHV